MAEVRAISAEATRPLRQAILRPHQQPHELVYPGDDTPETLHVGAYLDHELVSIASIYHEPPKDEADPATWRLRGMATVTKARGQGYGKALVRACLSHAAAGGGTTMWCNARIGAIGFYKKLGFDVCSEEFDIPEGGPHVMMRRAIGHS